jgi:hypothetical protein
MHGQMCTDTEASPHSATAPVALSGYASSTAAHMILRFAFTMKRAT